MKILILLAHPKKGSFNHAIAETAIQVLKKSGHEVTAHDLYEEKFDPLLPAEEIPIAAKVHPVIGKYCREVSGTDGFIIIHPNWWGQPPAILKGWVDRVIRAGVAYKFPDSGEGEPIGLLKGKTALIFNTSNTPEKREREIFGDPLEILWKNCIFNFCGTTDVHRKTFSVVVISSPEERKRWLEEAGQIVAKHFPAKK